ncbi:2550_t:CDS:2 [Funneliformis caledonium]|uniref:2550_t:CDS:1 n=1 Tax=Funneliformis caledonium TaxID=1117310 RepID=A0A9N9BQH3_9GLOM|nr:2550_t:CDS:2 [Funneliformis caledonium]
MKGKEKDNLMLDNTYEDNTQSEQHINSSSDDDKESHNLNDNESIDDNELNLDNYDDDFFTAPNSIKLDYDSDQEILKL